MECWQIEQPVFLDFSVTLQECVHLFWTLTEKWWGMKVVKLSINRSSSLVLTLRIVVKGLHTCFILVLCTDSVKRCTIFLFHLSEVGLYGVPTTICFWLSFECLP